MKKILFIAPFESVHINRWYEFFKNSRNFDTKLIICKSFMENTLFSKVFYLFTIKRKVIITINNFEPDVVNLHTLLFPNYLLPKHIKCKTVITPWNGDIIWHKYGKEILLIRYIKGVAKWFKERQIKNSLLRSDLITYNSNAMKGGIKKLLYKNIPCEYVQVPGVNTKKWIKTEKKAYLRRELNLPEDKFIVLSLRQLGAIYNIDIIVEAAYRLSKIEKDIFFLFIIPVLGKHTKVFKDKVSKYNLENKMKIVGPVEYEKLVQYLQACDIGVSISSRDSCPQSVLEGMSTQLPMIVGDIPVMRELVKDNYSALLTPCRDVYLLVEKIIKLKNNKNLREKLAKNARETVLEKYDYNKNMKNMYQLFLNM
ncbi:MAG: glycosyltransferase family 4 protein [Candidatus Cloacimonetes bacterium]|nr:glycosyltransferase family 4 protein [Candidatus Cloacimonadota bacterium]